MGGGSSKSDASQKTTNYAYDNRAAGTDHAISATSGAIINSTSLDGGAIQSAGDIALASIDASKTTAGQALQYVAGGFETYADKLGSILDKAIGASTQAQTSAENFAVQARMDAQTTQLTKIVPWIVAGAAAAFIMARA